MLFFLTFIHEAGVSVLLKTVIDDLLLTITTICHNIKGFIVAYCILNLYLTMSSY